MSRVTATISGFAREQRVRRSAIYRWLNRGLPRRDDGKLNVEEATRWVQENVTRRVRQGSKVGAGASLVAVRTRKTVAEAKLVELRVSRMAASLVSAADCRATWNRHVAFAQRTALRLPRQLAPALFAAKSTLERVAILDAGIRELLTELSKYEKAPEGGEK
jgi:hypothetical protein